MATKKTTVKKKPTGQKVLPKNELTKAKLKVADPKQKKLTIPKTPVKNIAEKIAATGLPKELIEMHLDNIYNHVPGKPKYEIGIRMLFCLADGWSIREAALLCGISEKTIYSNWGNPESDFYDENFAKILSLGIHLSELWWTSVGRANLNNKKEFDSTLWMMNMSNRFGWTRKLDGQILEDWHQFVKEEKEKRVQTISSESIIEAGKILERIGISRVIQNAVDAEVIEDEE